MGACGRNGIRQKESSTCHPTQNIGSNSLTRPPPPQCPRKAKENKRKTIENDGKLFMWLGFSTFCLHTRLRWLSHSPLVHSFHSKFQAQTLKTFDCFRNLVSLVFFSRCVDSRGFGSWQLIRPTGFTKNLNNIFRN